MQKYIFYFEMRVEKGKSDFLKEKKWFYLSGTADE